MCSISSAYQIINILLHPHRCKHSPPTFHASAVSRPTLLHVSAIVICHLHTHSLPNADLPLTFSLLFVELLSVTVVNLILQPKHYPERHFVHHGPPYDFPSSYLLYDLQPGHAASFISNHLQQIAVCFSLNWMLQQ